MLTAKVYVVLLHLFHAYDFYTVEEVTQLPRRQLTASQPPRSNARAAPRPTRTPLPPGGRKDERMALIYNTMMTRHEEEKQAADNARPPITLDIRAQMFYR